MQKQKIVEDFFLHRCNSSSMSCCSVLLQYQKPEAPEHSYPARSQDVLYALEAGTGCVGKRLLARCFQTLSRVFIR